MILTDGAKSNVNVKATGSVNTDPPSCDQIVEGVESQLTCSVAVETEPVYLGPCEPGTSVTLEGVVWYEGDSGESLFSIITCEINPVLLD